MNGKDPVFEGRTSCTIQCLSLAFSNASQGNMDIVKSLVGSGANMNIGTEHKPLKGALANGHYLVSAYLKLQGASL